MTSTPKVVLVPGGTGELGRAVSLAFLEQGDRVIVTYRKQEELNALKTVAGEMSRASKATNAISTTKPPSISSSNKSSRNMADSTLWSTPSAHSRAA